MAVVSKVLDQIKTTENVYYLVPVNMPRIYSKARPEEDNASRHND